MDKPKYLSRLTIKEWLALYKACYGVRAKKVVEVNFWQNLYGETRAEVTFLEPGWKVGNGRAMSLNTEYAFTDFNVPQCLEASGHASRRGFYEYMVKQFGAEYVADLFKHLTGVDITKYFKEAK